MSGDYSYSYAYSYRSMSDMWQLVTPYYPDMLNIGTPTSWIRTIRRCTKTLIKKQRRILRRLRKVYLHGGQGKDELSMLVGAKTSGATPLVIACKNGHYDVAEYLIEKCHADIEQPGSVVFDGDTIEDAPPLWCAAAAGHLPLVQLLVSHGAKVNSTTRTNSTPLRAACFDGHYDIVKYLVQNGADIEVANRHGHTCLMIACYKGHLRIAKFLLSLNVDVNRKSVKGNTALHDCAESGFLDILKLILEHGATMDVDSYGMTPLLAASVTGHHHIVEYLISLDGGSKVSRKQRVDALELLGATYVDKKRDMLGAVQLWKRAMDERFPAEGSPMPKPQGIRPVEAYDFVEEVTDPARLDDLLADPDEMRMQALVIRERILGPAHPDTSYYVRYRGAVYADAGRFERCRSLWHHALDMQRAMLGPVSPMTQSSLHSFAELFSFMTVERSRPPIRGRVVPPVTFEHLHPVFEKAVDELSRGMSLLIARPPTERDQTLGAVQRVLLVCLHLSSLMAHLIDEPECEEDTKEEIRKAVYSLVKMDLIVKNGRSALHLACIGEGIEGSRTSGVEDLSKLVKLLLRVGANPNARDADGNTPLHLAAKSDPCLPEVVKTLLENGAHIDMINYDGDTFQNILSSNGKQIWEIVNPLKYTTLKCIAAKAVVSYRLPYKSTLPRSLFPTIMTH